MFSLGTKGQVIPCLLLLLLLSIIGEANSKVHTALACRAPRQTNLINFKPSHESPSSGGFATVFVLELNQCNKNKLRNEHNTNCIG